MSSQSKRRQCIGYGFVAFAAGVIILYIGLFWNPQDAEQEAINTAWHEFAHEVAELTTTVQRAPFNQDDQTAADGYRHAARLLSTFLADATDFSDPNYPQFTRFPNAVARIGWDNPDNLYLSFRVRGDHEYRLRGNVRNFDLVTFVVYNGVIGRKPVWKLRTISRLASPDLDVDADGNFALTLSAEPQHGNWLPLTPEASVVIVRRIVSDWELTDPGVWEVVNLTTLGRGAPRATPESIMAGLQGAAEHARSLRTLLTIGHRLVFQLRLSPNEMSDPVASNTDFPMSEPFQAVSRGYFKLESDEALIVEVPVADCAYTGFQLANPWMESPDYGSHQTSLNHATVHVDADQRIRYVVSEQDPGTPNWIDTAGYKEGSLFARWSYCSEDPSAITSRVVQVADLPDLVPTDTPRVSPEERARIIASRQLALSRRYAGGL
ncbi:MAG: DUF1214 domain-containing protein [Acidobacteria bacterium]|nr:DUF1214 domain-containing protein [Acidobacteriota bacterium]MCY3968374.1 DUF1214 domain-containing protein [Acidobacteriota bacterium]